MNISSFDFLFFEHLLPDAVVAVHSRDELMILIKKLARYDRKTCSNLIMDLDKLASKCQGDVLKTAVYTLLQEPAYVQTVHS